MIPARCFLVAALLCLWADRCLAEPQPSLTPEQQVWLAKAKRSERAGWVYLHVEGEPRERGFQHGYLLAKEIADGLRVSRIEWQHQSAMDWPWLVARAAAMFVARIDAENLAEIDEWCDIMKRHNNGGYANAWLLGDANTREIARLELGLKYSAWEKKRDGYFIGSNVAEDRRILLKETDRKDTDIRLSSVARRVRWKQLMRDYTGKIDITLAKRFEADHFDTWRGKTMPGGRTLCGHFDLDPEPQGHDVPFDCSGTVDAKVVDAAMAKRLAFDARWGSACGVPFRAGKFLASHPQFEWLTDHLRDRPSQPWTTFHAGETSPK